MPDLLTAIQDTVFGRACVYQNPPLWFCRYLFKNTEPAASSRQGQCTCGSKQQDWFGDYKEGQQKGTHADQWFQGTSAHPQRTPRVEGSQKEGAQGALPSQQLQEVSENHMLL
ncbi:hypothetical protein WJX75_001850 [Coccomyxa subellipsoidea]|uniref:Uncharacterized protein n=1 Tax=Coccomyxa subellipsoidea TaxID=248742 RepID=A0ABR2YM01_9CHLO